MAQVKMLVALPAYNRNYDTSEACANDWEGGKDFKIANGPYFSIRDVKLMKDQGYTKVCIVQPYGGVLLEVTL